jgi:flagellar biosynthesis protein FliP
MSSVIKLLAVLIPATVLYRRLSAGALCCLLVALVMTPAAEAQTLDLSTVFDKNTGAVSGRIIQVLLGLTVLSLLPGLLMTVTCFTRFIIAFSFLRAGIGMQTTPSNLVLVNLALFMTWFVMAPTLERTWQQGVRPLVSEEITVSAALPRIVEPFREFMQKNTRESDLVRVQKMAEERNLTRGTSNAVEWPVQVVAFMLSELRRGFEIGFLIALPFLVIDMIVASIVMSMGMMMVSPAVFSLPLKVLFFVLIDGWSILVAGLIRSYS